MLLHIGLIAFSSLATPALPSLDRCTVGQRVLSPAGRVATVVSVQGAACMIRVDGQSYTDTYAAFMLSPAPGGQPPATGPSRPSTTAPAPRPSTGGGPAPGLYHCVSGAAGDLTLRILVGGRYADAQGVIGRYTFDPVSQRLAFNGGALEGYGGRRLDGGRLGLSADRNASFYQMTCDRRGN